MLFAALLEGVAQGLPLAREFCCKGCWKWRDASDTFKPHRNLSIVFIWVPFRFVLVLAVPCGFWLHIPRYKSLRVTKCSHAEQHRKVGS